VRPQRTLAPGQRATIVAGILTLVLILVVVQLWLLTATMNAHLAGDTGVLIPAGLASLACFLMSLGLLRYVYLLDR
jgi:hypothetical protein